MNEIRFLIDVLLDVGKPVFLNTEFLEKHKAKK